MNFRYKVSVIVPVYNVEEYLENCLNSLVAQTIDHSQMEVLLVNDGSTDRSLDICNKYAEMYSFFRIFSKENEGVSAARNLGIKNAQGKYIMYLDSDDTFTANTVKTVTDFFDTIYDKVDLVTYQERTYNSNGIPQALHFRYNYMKKTGIYDLTKQIYCCQTRLNIAVKNLHKRNYFFNENIGFHEDQIYCTDILSQKMVMGYVSGCEYRYNKRLGSITNENMNPIFLFEKTTSYWEQLFSKYETVPQYFQVLFFSDISWKIKLNTLFPYHYEKEELKCAFNRLKVLLDKVDDSVILNCPSTDNFHRHYFLNMKSDYRKISVIAENNQIVVLKNSSVIYKNSKMEIILNKLNIKNDSIFISAHLKSPVFNYIEPPKIYAELVYFDNTKESIELYTTISADSYYHTKEQTNNFYAFNECFYILDVKNIRFYIEIDGINYECYYYFMPYSPFSAKLGKYKALFNDYIVEYADNVFSIRHLNLEEYIFERNDLDSLYINKPEIYNIRKSALELKNKEIWIYYDCSGVEKDNGYYQFIHDFDKADGIERYFINANGELLDNRLFTEYHKDWIVDFASERHKVLYIAATKVITAFIEDRNVIPFSKEEIPYFCDISHPEVVYLQHGILHAHLPWKYAPGRIIADRIVVSSYFEIDNFINTYHFRNIDLIPSGMPRFDYVNKEAVASRRILFAPTWRNYLIQEDTERGWVIDKKKFTDSDYYININSFLNSERLNKYLEDKDIYIDFKIHPIFSPYLDCFDKNNSRICFAGSSVNDEEYAAFITDFSSFVFDFAYLRRSIMYFVPDMLQFKSGMNQYRELDLPFEKAFGNLVTDAESAVDEVIRICENEFTIDDVYKERMDGFFLPLINCSETLYRNLISKDKKPD